MLVRGAVPRLMRPGMRSDREEPVLDRLRGVMRVGCSGAKSEESSRWAATLAAAALRAWACCWRCSGDAYD